MELRNLFMGCVIRAAVVMLLLVEACCYAFAAGNWHEPPFALPQGLTVIGAIEPQVSTATIHARLAASSDTDSRWALVWGDDGRSCHRAVITIPAADKTDYYVDPVVTIAVESVADGVTTELSSTAIKSGIDTNGGYNSLKIVLGDGVATLYYGDDEQHEYGALPIALGEGNVGIWCSKPMYCQRSQVDASAVQQPSVSTYGSVDALMQHLRHSEDTLEGIWEYMDREMQPDMARPGGFYTLAVVANGDSYDIVYLKGSDINREYWQPLMIKGTLRPTIFEGDYDMEWIDAEGNALSRDTSARLSDDAAVLTLRFPLLSSQLRLRRLPLKTSLLLRVGD